MPIDTDRMPSWRLVVCSQNHDQVGNRAAGDRITETLDDEELACAALLTMTSPFTPMLFQGEEWAASTPFQFFTSHPEPELARATAEGRLAEFERMGWDPAVVPDPQDPATLERSRLDWSEAEKPRGARMLETYRRLARLRRRLPQLTDPTFARVACTVDEDARLFTMRRGEVLVAVNLGESAAALDIGTGDVVFETGSDVSLEAGTLSLPGRSGAVVAPRGAGLVRDFAAQVRT